MTWTKATATTKWTVIETLAVDMREQYIDLGQRLLQFKENEGWDLMGYDSYEALVDASKLDRKYLGQLMRQEQVRIDSELPDLSGSAANTLGRIGGPAQRKKAGELAAQRAKEEGHSTVTVKDAKWAVGKLAEKKPTPVESQKDTVGNDLPKHLHKVFGLIPEFKAIMHEIANTKARLKILSRKTDWMFNEQFIELQNCHKGVKFGIPHALCPYCKGEKKRQRDCQACRQMGYMPRQVYDKVPVADRLKGMVQ